MKWGKGKWGHIGQWQRDTQTTIRTLKKLWEKVEHTQQERDNISKNSFFECCNNAKTRFISKKNVDFLFFILQKVREKETNK